VGILPDGRNTHLQVRRRRIPDNDTIAAFARPLLDPQPSVRFAGANLIAGQEVLSEPFALRAIEDVE
jgi:hypothetical protein